ncbi:MAG: tetratricopeptide repeat protein [bacterium]
MKKILLILYFIVFGINYLFAQTNYDSLEKLINKFEGHQKLDFLNQLSLKYRAESPRKSILYGKQALELSLKLQDDTASANALSNIGAGYYLIGDFDNSLNNYQKSLKIFKKLNDKKGIAGIYNGIGLICRVLKKYDKAEEYYESSLKIVEEISDQQGISRALNNLGILYHLRNEDSKAKEYFEKSLKIKEVLGDKNGIANTLNNFGMLYSSIGDNTQSLHYYKESLKIKEEIGDKSGIIGNLINIGSLLSSMNKNQQALDSYTKAIEIAKNEGLKTLLIQGYISLSNIYEKLGKYKKSYEFFKLYSNLRDTVFSEESNKTIAEMEYNIAIEKQMKENEILKKENEYAGKVRLYLIIISILGILLAFFIYSRYRSKRKANAILTNKNEEIIQQKNELSTAYDTLEKTSLELENHNKFLQRLIDSIPNPVFIKDMNLKYTGCNREFEKFSGRKREELIGHSAKDFTSIEIAEMTNKMDNKILNSSEIQKYESRVLDGNKKEMDVIYYKTRFTDHKGIVAGLIGVMMDITDRKKDEQELKASEMKLREMNITMNKYLSVINSELSRAKEYLLSLLPPKISKGNIRTEWILKPSIQLAGDVFGYHWIDNDNIAIYLLDVSGHGIGAALHSVAILNTLKSERLRNTDFKNPGSVLKSLNKSFQMSKHDDMFFTIWYSVFNNKNNILKYASGGHPPALLIDKNGKKNLLHSPNCIIGVLPDFDVKVEEFLVNKGSSMFVFSDGAYEIKQKDGTYWGLENLCEFIMKSQKEDIDLLTTIYNYVKELSYNKTISDDYSMLKISFL